MGHHGWQRNQRSKVVVLFLVAPLAVIYPWTSAVSWPELTSIAMETSPPIFGSPPEVDGKRAYEYLKKICEIGPRTAGSKANERQRLMVKAHFQAMGAAVHEQEWRILHPQTGQPLSLVNLIGSWRPERLQRVVIGAHYDTRPYADEEIDPKRRAMPFVGANDGASGAALEMEISHHLNGLDTQWGVDLVFFDGEELVFGKNTGIGEYFLGSKEFARRYAELVDSERTQSRYVAGIVLDMVGGRDIQIKKEPKSVQLAPQLVQQVWSVADALRIKTFKSSFQSEVMDDHLPLNEANIPTIDLIEFDDYRKYWHRIDDVPDKCSARSLEDVGRVVTTWLAQRSAGVGETKRPRKRR